MQINAINSAALIVAVGLLFELAARVLLYPLASYEMYYTVCLLFQFILILASTYAVILAQGSLLIWAYMTITLVSMCLHSARINDGSNYWTLYAVTEYVVAPAYRVIEVCILTRFMFDCRTTLYNARAAALRKLRDVVLRGPHNPKEIS